MGGSPFAVFGRPAARAALGFTALAFAMACVAGGVRILPMLLGGLVAPSVTPLVARGAVSVALETAVIVGPALGFSLTAVRLVQGGEVRALAAIGVRPAALLRTAWPTLGACAVCAALAGGSWGVRARAPGGALGELVTAARAACRPESGPSRRPCISEAPMLGLAWVGWPGESPRLVGARFGGSAFAASAAGVELADDLRSARFFDLELVGTGVEPGVSVRIRAAEAAVRGLAPVVPSSNLEAGWRALLLAVTSALLAFGAGWAAFASKSSSRVGGAVLGAAGPAAALMTFSALERGPVALVTYAAVPVAGAAAIAVAAVFLRR